MKVLLLRDVPQLGRAGSLVEASDAYVRNFLLPQRLAQPATDGVIAAHERLQEKQHAQEVQHRQVIDEIVTKLTGVTIRLTGKASPQGKLFAALKSEDLERALAQMYQLKTKTFRCQPNHFKMIGQYQVTITLDDHHRIQLQLVIDHAEI